METSLNFPNVVRRIMANMFRELTPDDGLSAEELDAAEARLGLKFPRVLREFYELVGRFEPVLHSHNHVLQPTDFKVTNDGVIFLDENQGVCFWGLRIPDTDKDDPPAYQGNPAESAWYLESNWISAFLAKQLCWQIVAACDPLCGRKWNVGIDDWEKRLTGSLWRVEVANTEREDEQVCFCGDSIVVVLFPDARELHVGASSKRGERRFEELFQTTFPSY